MGATKNKVYCIVDGNPTDADHAVAMEIRLKKKIQVIMVNGNKIGDDIPTDCCGIVCNPKFNNLIPKFKAKGIDVVGNAPAQPEQPKAEEQPEAKPEAETEAKPNEATEAKEPPKKRGGRAKPKKIKDAGDDAPEGGDGGE